MADKHKPRFAAGGDLSTFKAFLKFKHVFFGKKTTDEDAKKKVKYW